MDVLHHKHDDDQTVCDWHREGLGQTSNWSQLNHAALSGSPTVEHMCQGQAHVHHHYWVLISLVMCQM